MITSFIVMFFGMGVIVSLIMTLLSISKKDGVMSFFWFMIFVVTMILMFESITLYYEWSVIVRK